nr:hypothetical protein Iba_chr02bCG8540 [Ipomoea batatas]
MLVEGLKEEEIDKSIFTFNFTNDGSAATLYNEQWSETLEVTEHLWRTKSTGWGAFVHSVSDTRCGLAFRKAGVREWAQDDVSREKQIGNERGFVGRAGVDKQKDQGVPPGME